MLEAEDDGCSEKGVEVIEEVRDEDAEQGQVENIQDVCVQELWVASSANARLKDEGVGGNSGGEDSEGGECRLAEEVDEARLRSEAGVEEPPEGKSEGCGGM